MALGAAPVPPVAPQFGKLSVKVMRGIDLKAGQGMFGHANPFARLKIGSQEFMTSVRRKGGKNPEFNEEFTFDISTEKEFFLELMDKQDVGGDKFMGKLTCDIMDWIAQKRFDGDLEVVDKSNRAVGKVKLSVRFEKPGAAGSAAAPGMSQTAGAGAMVPVGEAEAPSAAQVDPPRDPSGKFTDDEIWEAFQAFDLDHNNFVGAAEIRHVLINIGEQVTDEEVDEMIRMCDHDGDGQVSFPEFFEMVTGGRRPPPGLGVAGGAEGAAGAAGRGAPPPPSGVSVVQQRNNKRKALSEFAGDNNIKPESIKKAYKRFQQADQDKSGMVDYTEFCEILTVDPSPQCEKVFQLFDYEKSGQIDVKEFLIALTNFSGAGKDDKLKFAFMLFDEDGNGVITKSELIKILKANHMAGSDAEVARKAETIMTQADKDGDGVVTFDEFVVVSKKFPNVLFPAYTSA